MQYLKYKEKISRGTIDFPVGYYFLSKNHPQYSTPYHWHEELELIHIVSGVFEFSINGVTTRAEADDVLIINSGFLHGGTPYNCAYECLVFPISLLFNQTYSSSFLTSLDNQELILTEYFHRDDSSAIPALVKTLFSTIRNSDEGSKLQSLGILYQLMGTLLEQGYYQSTDKASLSSHKNIYLLKNVFHYINDHYGEKIQLQELAQAAGMSPKYFCRFFFEMTGKTPIDYVNYYRIEKACYQLVNTNGSITDIALSCGFNDVSYFIRTFKKYKGKSPKQYLQTPLQDE